MAKPIVAIVGRPNVGKSQLFNRLAGKRLSIVEDTPGVTRDRLYADSDWRGRDFTVIATGGSVVYEPNAMAHLSQLGTVVYLKLGYKALARRLGNLEKRGVVLRPGQTLRMLYDERVPLYEQYAHITVDCGGQDIEHTLRRVRRALEKRGNLTK